MNIIWIAPPAAGKGTYCQIFKERYGFNHISIGDVLRKESSKDTPLGNKLREELEAGIMVDNKLTIELLKNELLTFDLSKPFMIDGYPRLLDQADDYQELLDELKLEKPIVIYINLSKEEGLKRALSRYNCPKCKRSYNINDDNFKPKVDGICDYCGEKLLHRSDDNEESYATRYGIFFNETKDVIEKYRKENKFIEVDGTKNPEDNIKDIIKILGVNND